jgi:DNA repair exonuclease SbcCD ATPase subunit
MNGSTTSFHSNNQAVVPQGQWFSGNDLNNDNSEDFDGFSSYTVSPEVNDHSEWNSHYRRVQELEAENQVLMEEINKFQEFKELNEVLIEESDILREKLAILKENTEYANTNRDGDLIKLQQLNKEQEQKIDDHAKEKESFELKLEAMTQEITKLKLIHIESNRAKTKQIETLKEENEELLKELEVYYQKGTSSALTSLESTPKSSPMEYNYNSASTQETPPEVHQKTFQQGTLPYNNEELVADLLITIRQLKSENEMLVEQKENISSNLVRQKKFVKKFASGNRSNNKVKVRKGLSIVESIDVLI